MRPEGRQLTAQAQAWHRTRIGAGDLVLDATLGNGHDACFLADCVGPAGHLFGFDCQSAAVEASRARLHRAGLIERATLFHAGHEQIGQLMPASSHGRITAAMFNLGYLPGSDKSVRTQPRTTLAALEQVWGLLASGGGLSIMVYIGHPGGEAELAAVSHWVLKREQVACSIDRHSGTAPGSPQLFLVIK